ncbi:cysteine dioxygenase family protein [Streptomyces sp. SID3343]|uniref:cysteine dioxygenase n=1 Tax=Streptomyces sp. SID3343 TaxID=2690260 RepID=UPI001370256E|nr:cysteine dioxygenase family protein [Streptomyces sp. SID3343]MYW00093.1 cysteine dioxygenase [Streptomyces sp. SID3343]
MSSDITVAGDPLAAPARLALPVAPAVRPAVARLAALARQHADLVAAELDQVRYDPVSRWYKRLAATEDMEIWLLSWLPGQGTGLHDHGGSSGVFTVVSGELHERSLVITPLRRAGARERVLTAGSARVFGPTYVHEVTNMGTEPAVSVHVYAPKLNSMTLYDGTADIARPSFEPLRRLGVERSGEQW